MEMCVYMCATCFGLYLDHQRGTAIPKSYEERYNEIEYRGTIDYNHNFPIIVKKYNVKSYNIEMYKKKIIFKSVYIEIFH
jgi:hypothetical protein